MSNLQTKLKINAVGRVCELVRELRDREPEQLGGGAEASA